MDPRLQQQIALQHQRQGQQMQQPFVQRQQQMGAMPQQQAMPQQAAMPMPPAGQGYAVAGTRPLASAGTRPENANAKYMKILNKPENMDTAPEQMHGKESSDPVTVVAKTLVVLAMAGTTYLVPVDLRFLWMMLFGLLIVGEMGLHIFHAWIQTSESNNSALWVLYLVSGVFISVLLALLLFLGLKLVMIMQRGKHDNEYDRRQAMRKERSRRIMMERAQREDEQGQPQPTPENSDFDGGDEKYERFIDKRPRDPDFDDDDYPNNK